MFKINRKYDEENFQTPPGLNLIFLPYADDLRDLDTVKGAELNSETEPSRVHILTAKRMINAMSTDFDAKNFENPDVQMFYSSIQALALEQDEIEQVEDHIQPDLEGLGEISELIVKFRDICFGEDYQDLDQRAELAEMLSKRVGLVFISLKRRMGQLRCLGLICKKLS